MSILPQNTVDKSAPAPIDYERARVVKLEREVARLRRLLDHHLTKRGVRSARSPITKGEEQAINS